MARKKHIFIILLMMLWVSVTKAQSAFDVSDSITVSGLVKIGAIEPEKASRQVLDENGELND